MARVLLVEDDKFLTKLLNLKLEKEGIEVIPSYNGDDALKKIKENNFDLIILDLILP